LSLINNLNNTDFIVMLITLISMFYGYNRGLVKEILSILSLIFSGYLSLNFYPNISKFLKQYINLDYLTDALSFGILFLFIYSVLVIFSGFIAKFIKSISLEILDKNLGIIFGFIRSLFLLSIINILMIWFVWREDIPIWIKEAKSANIINYSSNILLNFVPKKNIVDLEQTFDIKIKEKMSLYPKFNEDIKKLSEPAMKNPKINSKGYSKNDNESLDQLFNIENDD